ncbi:MAG: hypothetical protein RBR97_16690 [Bacteroidales bacterium]|nr:hypothetical protein [Bacteroidales bacterium]
MSVNQFMSANLVAIQRIIGQLQRPFDSHAFIQKLSREFQVEYVQLLSAYTDEPFIKVHGQIGKFLSENQTTLGIRQNNKVLSKNIFGEQSENEEWV